MSEVGGITELQMLEAELALLKTKLDMSSGAEKSSVACSRIVENIHSSEVNDSFVITEGGSPNLFHTSAGTAKEGDCCILL